MKISDMVQVMLWDIVKGLGIFLLVISATVAAAFSIILIGSIIFWDFSLFADPLWFTIPGVLCLIGWLIFLIRTWIRNIEDRFKELERIR